VPVLFDAGFVGLLLHPDARIPDDPESGLPVHRAKDRVERLVSELEEDGVRVLIPAPVIAEFLVLAKDSGPEYLAILNQSARFEIVPFDLRAAVEMAAATLLAVSSGDKRSGLAATPWQKIKIDRQIVAIAKTRGVNVIYSNDSDVTKLGRDCKLDVRHVATLPMPDDANPLFAVLDEN